MKIIITNNEQETFNLGKSLGKKCCGGEIFALQGNLGSGKTKFTQGLAQGLGVLNNVNSPTFNIFKLYKLNGRIKYFCHLDTYRLKSEEDLISLGVEEFFNSPEAVVVIEWAEKVKKILPVRAKIIKIESLSPQTRKISIY